jgi:L-ribulose-5-phosphate 4-epimerase
VIVEAFAGRDPERVPGVLEEVAALALHTVQLAPDGGPIDPALLDRHFLRKRGADAY